MIPIRYIFRSRWAALIWAAGICLSAAHFAGGDTAAIDAANGTDGNATQTSALLGALS